MNHTAIEWVKNPDGTQGYTWNPITGCLNGCPYCYARKLANGRLKQRYLANKNVALLETEQYEPIFIEKSQYDPFYPRFWEKKLAEPYTKTTRWGSSRRYTQNPKGIFVCDMSDLFGLGIPEEWTRKVLKVISDNPQHRFYLLTKQPQNLIKFSPFPDNCFVGVTVTDGHKFVEACNHLIHVEAKTIYLSLEPLLDWHIPPDILSGDLTAQQINWLIIGAQTKPYKPPKIEWVEEIVRAADRAGVPVFLKDNLLELANYKSPETEFAFNKEGYYRQEMPE